MSKHLFILLFFIQWLPCSDFSDAIDAFIEGEIALLSGNQKLAIDKMNEAINIYPYSFTIYQTLGSIYQNQFDYLNALKYYKKSFELNNNEELGFLILNLYKEVGQDDSAFNFLEKLSDTFKSNSQLLYEKAQFYFRAQNWVGIINTYIEIYKLERDSEILDKIIEIGNATGTIEYIYEQLLNIDISNKDETKLQNLLAKMAYSLNQYEKAIFHLKELKKVNESNTVYLMLADTYMKLENFSKAKINLEHVFNSNPYDFELMRALLICYSSLDEKTNEIRISKLMIDSFPEESLGYESYALLLLDNKEYSNAISVLISAKKMFPDNILILYYLGTAYKQIFDNNNALEEFKQAIKLHPESQFVLHSMALIYEEMQNYRVSDSLFNKILNTDKSNAMNMNDYAYLISERKNSSRKDLEYALKLAKSANSLEPSNSMILDTLGWIHFQMGNLKIALEFLNDSVELGGENPIILEHLGDVYLKMGNIEEAKDIFFRAIELSPNNQKLKEKIESFDN